MLDIVDHPFPTLATLLWVEGFLVPSIFVAGAWSSRPNTILVQDIYKKTITQHELYQAFLIFSKEIIKEKKRRKTNVKHQWIVYQA